MGDHIRKSASVKGSLEPTWRQFFDFALKGKEEVRPACSFAPASVIPRFSAFALDHLSALETLVLLQLSLRTKNTKQVTVTVCDWDPIHASRPLGSVTIPAAVLLQDCRALQPPPGPSAQGLAGFSTSKSISASSAVRDGSKEALRDKAQSANFDEKKVSSQASLGSTTNAAAKALTPGSSGGDGGALFSERTEPPAPPKPEPEASSVSVSYKLFDSRQPPSPVRPPCTRRAPRTGDCVRARHQRGGATRPQRVALVRHNLRPGRSRARTSARVPPAAHHCRASCILVRARAR